MRFGTCDVISQYCFLCIVRGQPPYRVKIQPVRSAVRDVVTPTQSGAPA